MALGLIRSPSSPPSPKRLGMGEPCPSSKENNSRNRAGRRFLRSFQSVVSSNRLINVVGGGGVFPPPPPPVISGGGVFGGVHGGGVYGGGVCGGGGMYGGGV